MAATIGNFSSGDVLTAAQMNTLGFEFLDDQTFSGYGGVSSDVLSSDFDTYFVSFYGKLVTSVSGLYLRFRRGGSELSSSNYEYSSAFNQFSNGTIGSNYGSAVTNMRIGGVSSTGGMVSMFITLGYDNRAMATWQTFYGGNASYNGAGQFHDGTAVDGFKIYRTSNNATLRVRVYGLRN